MDIKVLGPGCANCKKLFEKTDQALKTLGMEVTLTKVEKMDEIKKYKILMTPALVIDGEVKVAGRIPNDAELTSLLTTAAMKP